MTILGIILAIIGLVCIIYSVYSVKHVHQINKSIDFANSQKQERSEQLDLDIQSKQSEIENLENKNYNIIREYQNDLDLKKQQVSHLSSTIEDKQKQLEQLQQNVTKSIENQKQLSQAAFENYCSMLVQSYDIKEKEYQDNITKLEEQYSNKQIELSKKIESTREENNRQLEEEKLKIAEELGQIRAELEKMRSTRAAAIQAQLKEVEIKENSDNYRLNLSEVELKDIRLLKSIQSQITNSIVIDKIIWSNYYQPLAKAKFPKIIGKSTTCGVYKLTDLTTGLVYVGQSLDICDRWKTHCKNALGVGTAADNKLYKQMRDSGLHNFTFEVLEECDSSQLDEEERYFINLYDSYTFGLNGTQGNK